MEKKPLVKKILAGILYTVGILFALYIFILTFYDALTLGLKDILISSMGVYIPAALATYILMSIENEYGERLKIMRRLVLIIFTFYNMLLICLLFFGRLQYIGIRTISISQYIKEYANFVPFKTITKYIKSLTNHTMSKTIITENLLGNLFVFAPMGILLPCIFKKLHKFKNFLITILIILFSVETIQLLMCTRTFDIDDVILNSIGAVLFFGLWKTNLVQRLLIKMYIMKDDSTETVAV